MIDLRHGDALTVLKTLPTASVQRVVTSPPSQYESGTTANRLALLRQAARERGGEYASAARTTGWRPSCKCDAGDPIPCTVLDPFAGSGTTLAVAVGLGRRGIGIELNAAYIELAERRIGKVARPLPLVSR